VISALSSTPFQLRNRGKKTTTREVSGYVSPRNCWKRGEGFASSGKRKKCRDAALFGLRKNWQGKLARGKINWQGTARKKGGRFAGLARDKRKGGRFLSDWQGTSEKGEDFCKETGKEERKRGRIFALDMEDYVQAKNVLYRRR